MKFSLLPGVWLFLLITGLSRLNAEILWDADGLGVVNRLASPDGRGDLHCQNGPPGAPPRSISFEKKGVPKLNLGFENMGGPTLAAWSGSSKFVFLVTGQHNQQTLEVIHPARGQFRVDAVDYAPIYHYGENVLPAGSKLAHDEILDTKSGPGDSVRCLYLRTGDFPKACVITVAITFDDSEPSRSSCAFGPVTWLDRDRDLDSDRLRRSWK